ncbi:unnamed protein product [Diamesa hyperborea]
MLLVSTCIAQENAQPRVAPGVVECYRRADLFERDNRLPMTPSMLIELIRKVEDAPGSNQGIRQIATGLLHRFRQDGIIPARGININQNDILRFSTNGFNFPKHRVLLSRLIQGNANQFPISNLTIQEQCALHFMMSTSIETQIRGDEATRCNQLSQYRAMRNPRAVKNSASEDVEMMKTPEMANVRNRIHKKFGKYQKEDDDEHEAEEEPVEHEETDSENELVEVSEHQDIGLVDVASNAVSQCPLENGVLHSQWGSFSAGPVIAGLAAGLQPLQVNVRDLIPQGRMGEYRSARQQSGGMTVDNRYAATLSGDLAEVVLRQAPAAAQVGAAGAWNNTAAPHWYFLSQRERLEMTDAEIRGGLDGLIMGMNIVEWASRASNLRLSQVLDMYYSQRGVFGNNDFRACNRRAMFTTVVPIQRLRDEANAFTTVLDGEMQTQVTLNLNSTQRISEQAADALSTYIPNTLNDLTCASTSTTPNDETIWRTATDIYIFVDMSWTFREIQPMLGHVLNNLDVGRFGSTYTILNAMDGTVIVNATNQLSDLYIQWNQTVHDLHPNGLNLPNILREMRTISVNLLNHERDSVQVGGRSTIALIMPQTAAVSEADTNFAVQQMQIFREEVPDLRFIFWAGGSQNRFERFVREPARDVYPLRIVTNGIGGDSIQALSFPVIHRIQQEPRRIINHRCGGNWASENQGNNQMVQYVEPRGIVFYRLHPNYFYGGTGSQRRLRIQGAGFSSITVCHSRTVERPRANVTNVERQQGEVTCVPVNTDTVEIDIANGCGGHDFINHCPPLFISIEGPANHDGLNLRCTDRDCRFPDNSRFLILTENLGCFSGVTNVMASMLLIVVSIFFTVRL